MYVEKVLFFHVTLNSYLYPSPKYCTATKIIITIAMKVKVESSLNAMLAWNNIIIITMKDDDNSDRERRATLYIIVPTSNGSETKQSFEQC